ncbi:MAG: hypothetical protein HS111_28750 [Kofleriaceae bacterium]|nr:hypothetical protein [Kofleriaceae bacterium]
MEDGGRSGGVASLTVTANLAEPVTLVDTDPSPGRFAATYATAGLPEGGLTLAAEAADSEGNVTTSTRRWW